MRVGFTLIILIEDTQQALPLQSPPSFRANRRQSLPF